jgi:hypothetical protein
VSGHIKIPAVPLRQTYVGDGVQRAFAFPFPIFADEDVEVHLGAARQVTGYGVSGAGVTAGGTVTFDTPPEAGLRITLRRRLPVERLTDFLESGRLPALALNEEFDYLTACLQQVSEDGAQALRYGPTDLPASTLLPDRDQRTNRVLAFDGSGNPTVAPIVDAEEVSSFLVPGAGAVRRPVRDRLAEIVSVRDFGAVGDGIADDTVAFQAALGASAAVFVPVGTWRIGGTLTLRHGARLHGAGQGSVLRATGDGFDLVEMTEGYASLENLRLEGGRTGIRLHGRHAPCVQNAVQDVTVWDARWGIVLDGLSSPDRPCYWNNFSRVLVARPVEHGVWLTRSGAGDTPNANRFHCVRVYSLGHPTSGSGFHVEHGRYNNAFVDCEANLATTAHSCFRIGPHAEKTLLVNLYTETIGGVPNVLLDPGSVETAIVNLFSASGGPAIWDQSGGEYTAVNAGYPEKNRLRQSRMTVLTVEALRFDTEYVEPQAGGLVELGLGSSVYLVSAYGGPVEARLPAAGDANGHWVTIKKADLGSHPVSVTEAGGGGPDGRKVVLRHRFDFVTCVSNGAAWWVAASNRMPGNAGHHEGPSLLVPDLDRELWLVSAYGGPTEVRLPAPSDAQAAGRTVTIKKADVSANPVTVTQSGGGGPDGEAIPLPEKGHAVTVMSNGAAWHILSRHP